MSQRHAAISRDESRALEAGLAGLLGELAQGAGSGGNRPVLFTAPSPGIGTTSVCATAARALADSLELPVTLIEANLEEPRLAERLALEPGPGLAQVLDGSSELEDALLAAPGLPSLWVLPAGRHRDPRPGELGSRRMREVLTELGVGRRTLLIDGPPLSQIALTSGLLRLAADIVLVLDARHTRRDAALEAARTCTLGGSRLLGTVLNHA